MVSYLLIGDWLLVICDECKLFIDTPLMIDDWWMIFAGWLIVDDFIGIYIWLLIGLWYFPMIDDYLMTVIFIDEWFIWLYALNVYEWWYY